MRIQHLNERAWLKGLAVECPLGNALSSCPMNGFRHLPTSQIRHIVGQLGDDQVYATLKIHHQCFEERVKKLSKSGNRPFFSTGGEP